MKSSLSDNSIKRNFLKNLDVAEIILRINLTTFRSGEKTKRDSKGGKRNNAGDSDEESPPHAKQVKKKSKK